MSEIDLGKMKADALAATQGEWEIDADERYPIITNGFHDVCELTVGQSSKRDANAVHIANCGPPTIITMIDRLEKAEAERDEVWAAIGANDERSLTSEEATRTVCGVCQREFPSYDAWNVHADLVHTTEDQRRRMAEFTGRDAT